MPYGYDRTWHKRENLKSDVMIGAPDQDLCLEVLCDVDVVIELYLEVDQGHTVEATADVDAVNGIDKIHEVTLNGVLMPPSTHNDIEDLLMRHHKLHGMSSQLASAAEDACFEHDHNWE